MAETSIFSQAKQVYDDFIHDLWSLGETENVTIFRKGTQITGLVVAGVYGARSVTSLAKVVYAVATGSLLSTVFWASALVFYSDLCRFGFSVFKYGSNASNTWDLSTLELANTVSSFFGISIHNKVAKQYLSKVSTIVTECSKNTLVLRHIVDLVKQAAR